jgi:hypothetical protein
MGWFLIPGLIAYGHGLSTTQQLKFVIANFGAFIGSGLAGYACLNWLSSRLGMVAASLIGFVVFRGLRWYSIKMLSRRFDLAGADNPRISTSVT